MYEKRKRVLVVDDDEGVRLYIGEVMRSAGWDVFEAENGREALDRTAMEIPDLIILDIMMPEMDGLSVFRELRGNFFTKRVPVIMLTAVNDSRRQDIMNESSMEKELGVPRPEAFVDKPVDPEFLLNTIMGVVG
jgi:CheY-like chemotaxis protein